MKALDRKWWMVDASGHILGRLASRIATVLTGKNKPTYQPHQDCGDFVVVLNSDKLEVSGRKTENKTYYHHSFYPGGLKAIEFKRMFERHPERVLYLAVKNMLPKNRLRTQRLKRLKIYASDTHPHQAQNPQPLHIGGSRGS